MAQTWRKRGAVAIAGAVLLLCGGLPSAAADTADTLDTADKDTDILLVHGYGSSCAAMNKAKDYFEDERGHDGAVKTLGYYANEKKSDCTDTFKDDATTNTDIQYVARDLAKYVYEHYTKQGKPVNIVAHSMGGLVTRVALLGSGQHWDDPNFPDKRLNVPNAVTLSTPHQGVIDTDKHDTDQWQQMNPKSSFMKRLHRDDSELNEDWNCGGSGPCTTDWTLVGSREDGTVSYKSGIDQGNPAHKKFGYQAADDGGDVTHGNIRELDSGRYDLHYWHSGGHPRHETEDGWAPLKTAYEAATRRDDNLPR